ncbi:MAG: DNA polymerase III subunit delta [Armatimonadetes bacterium]|nr:DNA polymerase III subunit delta [Armatimonadota bacterium]
MSAKAKTTEEPRAYLLRGDDDFQKHQFLDDLTGKLVSPDFADFDLEPMEGDTATSDRVMAGLGVPPFGPRRRVVLVRYANKMHPDEQLKLASRLNKIPPSSCLILVNPAPEKVDGRPRKGSEVIGDLSKAARKVGEVHDFGGGTGREKTVKAREFAQSIFTKAGKKLDSQAMTLFLQRAGTDFSVINSEARKLIDYSGDAAAISSRDVALVTSETPEEKVFKLMDAVSAKNQAGALKFLDELFEIGDDVDADAPKTLATMARQFRLIWQARMLMEAGTGTLEKSAVPEHLRSQLPSDPNILDVTSRQKWQGERLAQQARRFKHSDLVRCFSAIARADLMLKGIEGDIEDPRLVMELLIIELAR